jgi:(2S)-methylsuccinyl-CoA dehydrogenase
MQRRPLTESAARRVTYLLPLMQHAPHADASDLLDCAARAELAASRYLGDALQAVRARVAPTGRSDAKLIDVHQHVVHGLAWIATYVEAMRQMLAWAQALDRAQQLRECERSILTLLYGEYLAQLCGGIPMSQLEVARPGDLGLQSAAARLGADAAAAGLMQAAFEPALRRRVAQLLAQGESPRFHLADQALELIQEQFRRFTDEKVAPHAHGWHLDNALIPLPLIEELGEMGVFGLSLAPEHGGSGLGKLAMCVVSEELSRGNLGVGSLATRSEIACELIASSGTLEQQQRFLPGLASGAIIPTAVFTEPDTGSDLASIRTRAQLVMRADGSRVWRVFGAKTWITHAARADLMTLLVRTDPDATGYRGLSMLLAEKPRARDGELFPAPGMSGGEIHVLGYRGMREYEIAFDGFEVPESHLLGGVPGEGFKQLMQTFEGARIQTGARAVGVAQNAFELALRYALERRQFGRPIFEFPRVHAKLAAMAAEVMAARQLNYFAARSKDGATRCDVQAGMAKLLGARVAWACADGAVQIHGGNGFALEYPASRLLCDARVLSIFEGAAEIQAGIIARALLG